MSTALPPSSWLGNRRNLAAAAMFAVAISLAIAIGVYNRGGFAGFGGTNVGDAVRQGVNQGINGINALGETVAGLFGSRSPGERADGTLANLKQRKGSALHQRALPKVRPGPLAAIVGAPPVPPVLPSEAAPLYNVVTDAPKALLPGTPLALTPTPGGAGGFPGLTPLPGGGGVIIPPPAITPPENPTTPTTPTTPTIPTTPTTPTAPVPEPATWLMMMLGFAMIGATVRRSRPRALLVLPT